jgi:hypothetical protein
VHDGQSVIQIIMPVENIVPIFQVPTWLMKAAEAAAVPVVVVQEGCSLQQQPVQWLQALRTGLGTGDGKHCFCSAIVSRLACSGCICVMLIMTVLNHVCG